MVHYSGVVSRVHYITLLKAGGGVTAYAGMMFSHRAAGFQRDWKHPVLEAEQFNPWLEGAAGYLTHCLNAYDANPVWTEDPKRTVYRDVAKRSLTAGGEGSVGEKAAAIAKRAYKEGRTVLEVALERKPVPLSDDEVLASAAPAPAAEEVRTPAAKRSVKH